MTEVRHSKFKTFGGILLKNRMRTVSATLISICWASAIYQALQRVYNMISSAQSHSQVGRWESSQEKRQDKAMWWVPLSLPSAHVSQKEAASLSGQLSSGVEHGWSLGAVDSSPYGVLRPLGAIINIRQDVGQYLIGCEWPKWRLTGQDE